jgi:hypothetical protein
MILIIPSEEALGALSAFRCLVCLLPLGIHTSRELATCRDHLTRHPVTSQDQSGGHNPLSPAHPAGMRSLA